MALFETEDLTKWVKEQSETYFHRPFTHHAYWNRRLRSTGGRYNPRTHHLEFNPKYLKDYSLEVMYGLIRHELCHYHLHLMNKGYHHGDADFKHLLKQVGGLRYAPPLPENKPKYHYRCLWSHNDFYRQRRVDTIKSVCGICLGRLELIEDE
ncbi:MAG: SprT family protein [Aerococcus sp.]|nr:SprT family protein [Aerococcus sp.]